MEKENLKGMLKKLTASVAVFTMLTSYAPAMLNIAKAVEETGSKENVILNEKITNSDSTKSTDEESQEVVISNSTLRQYLLENHDSDGDGKISIKDLEEIEQFVFIYYSDNETIDLDFLKYCRKMTYFEVRGSNFINTEVLKNSSTLTDVSVADSITNISWIETLPNLTHLLLINVDLSNVNWNNINSKLTYLSLSSAELTDISFITRFQELNQLDLGKNDIEDITPIKQISNLNVLNINLTDKIMDKIEELDILDTVYTQEVTEDVNIEKGKTKEINVPSIVKKLLDENSKLYSETPIKLEVPQYPQTGVAFSLSEDKSKIVLDASNAGSEKNQIRITISGDDNRNCAVITINCTVYEQVSEKVEIEIPDATFKQILLKDYDADGDKVITNYDMLQIKSLDILPDNDVRDLTGIKYAQNLEELSISTYNCENILEINELTKLKKLEVNGDSVIKLLELTILTSLEELYIMLPLEMENNAETEIYNKIGTLKNLKNLRIESNVDSKIDLNTIKDLTNLEYLHLVLNITNVDVLENFVNLRYLYLTKGSLDNIGFISKLINLETAILDDNEISDITPLKNLEKLTYVNLYRNPINTKETKNKETLEILRNRKVQVDIIETDAITNIEFKDENFKLALIESGVDSNKDNQISIDEMHEMTNLYINTNLDTKFTSIEEIEYATNVRYLSIYSSPIEDLTPILKLSNLESFSYNNEITQNSLDVITKLKSLKVLEIYDSKDILKDLEPLSTMKELTRLKIVKYGDRAILNIKGIEKLTNIDSLELFGEISNIEYIKQLEKLRRLDISSILYDGNNKKLSEKEIVEFLNILKLDSVMIYGANREIDLGDVLIGSKKTIDLTEISEIIKALYTEGNILYCPDTRIDIYGPNNPFTFEDKKLTLNTENLSKYVVRINIKGKTLNEYIDLHWRSSAKGDVSKIIDIPDKNLEKLLLEKYDIDDDKKITEHDMVNIAELNIVNKNISNLEGLQHAINMTSLEAGYNNISDLSQIANLEKLEFIDLNNNLITDLSILEHVKWSKDGYIRVEGNYINFANENKNYTLLKQYIYSLYEGEEDNNAEEEFQYNINKQSIGDIKQVNQPLELDANLKRKLIKLGIDTNRDNQITPRELQFTWIILNPTFSDESVRVPEIVNLSNSNISNISGLEYINAYNLNLSGNNISDITPITKNREVTNLDLSNNNIIDISGIENGYFETLNLSNNKIVNIEPITKLKRLRSDSWQRFVDIDLSNNEISNITCVKDWKNLNNLNLSNNKITDISELKNYNFTIGKDEEGNDIEQIDKLTINLSGNNIKMTVQGNKVAKELFDGKGAKLILEDNSATTVYVTNANGYYSLDSNMGVVHTNLTQNQEYKFVPEKDRTYYPSGSDESLSGIFVNTVYYNSNKEHEDKLKQEGYDKEIIITGAIKTKEPVRYNQALITTLRVPEGYIGNLAKTNNPKTMITQATRNTITVNLTLTPNKEDNLYYTIEGAVYLKAREQVITNTANKEEILEAINAEQNVTLDMKQDAKEISNQVFEILYNKDDVELKVETQKAKWTFNSDTITNKEIALNPTVVLSDTKFENMEEASSKNGIFIKFNHEGNLPGKAEIELDIKDCATKYENGKTVYLYYYAPTKKKYEYISTITANDSKVKIMLEHCSEYFITDEQLPTGGKLGDTDGNEKITTKDAKMVLQHIVKKITLTDDQIARADASKDGKITTKDAKMILQHIVKKIVLE